MAEFKVGDRVRHLDGEIGVVTDRTLVVYLGVKLSDGAHLHEASTEFTLYPETPAEAWAQVGVIIARMLNKFVLPIWENDRKAVRHECYTFLGSHGVKITEEVKQQVRHLVSEYEKALDL